MNSAAASVWAVSGDGGNGGLRIVVGGGIPGAGGGGTSDDETEAPRIPYALVLLVEFVAAVFTDDEFTLAYAGAEP